MAIVFAYVIDKMFRFSSCSVMVSSLWQSMFLSSPLYNLQTLLNSYCMAVAFN